MKKVMVATIFAISLSACAGLQPPPAGSSEAAVIASLGQPTGRYTQGSNTMLEYTQGPLGQTTYMAKLGSDGRLLSFEQVLTSEKFASVAIQRDTKQSILATLGRPNEVVHYASVDGDVWLYRYKEQRVWDSMMHVEFDRNGVVQAMVNGPDPDRQGRQLR
ncbi:outer membrane protein assembly factor BamE domain-containing protein [Duganella qianjiadongensis]|uniref:Outer membrane protein assembly factor BamE n=1 Tax=Duganella qianjiadongensis TaxID=2692176 RepID=A0ABW9VN51_9BURK|nr:outer membrane protein assembly factor BamE [Duganella qianjiadongensis]MYM40910.1 outer membrane protein assembly factor BamE [Duganella qianjiadongensis]